jgi:hypothetical protein
VDTTSRPQPERRGGTAGFAGAHGQISGVRRHRQMGFDISPQDPEGAETYIVRRWFTPRGATRRRERGEVITPQSDAGCDDRYLRDLVADWFLDPLPAGTTHIWRCPCGRCWATREAYDAHGCSELPEIAEAANEKDLPAPTGRDAEIVRSWILGEPPSEIASRHCISTKRLHNRLSELRERYGREAVPLRRWRGASATRRE